MDQRPAGGVLGIAPHLVKDSANFPHHLTNGCKALAEAVLEHGLDDRPPLNAAMEKSAAYKREYYEGRFRP